MAKEILPSIMPGLLGLFIAALLAGVMSSCDSFMISSSALFTENLYRPIVKEKSKSHYLEDLNLSNNPLILVIYVGKL